MAVPQLRPGASDSLAAAALAWATHMPAGRCIAGWPCAAAGWPPPAAGAQHGRAASGQPRPRGSGAHSGWSAPRGPSASATPPHTADAESARTQFTHFLLKRSFRKQETKYS